MSEQPTPEKPYTSFKDKGGHLNVIDLENPLLLANVNEVNADKNFIRVIVPHGIRGAKNSGKTLIEEERELVAKGWVKIEEICQETAWNPENPQIIDTDSYRQPMDTLTYSVDNSANLFKIPAGQVTFVQIYRYEYKDDDGLIRVRAEYAVYRPKDFIAHDDARLI